MMRTIKLVLRFKSLLSVFILPAIYHQSRLRFTPSCRAAQILLDISLLDNELGFFITIPGNSVALLSLQKNTDEVFNKFSHNNNLWQLNAEANASLAIIKF